MRLACSALVIRLMHMGSIMAGCWCGIIKCSEQRAAGRFLADVALSCCFLQVANRHSLIAKQKYLLNCRLTVLLAEPEQSMQLSVRWRGLRSQAALGPSAQLQTVLGGGIWYQRAPCIIATACACDTLAVRHGLHSCCALHNLRS